MDKTLMVTEIERMHQSMISVINSAFERLVISVENDENENGQNTTSGEYTVPLSSNPSIFIGRKPTAILLGDTRIKAKTWIEVFVCILTHCNQDPVYHGRLMELRGKAAGKVRLFLSESTEGMSKSVKISEDLYAEAHYGSQTLMNILVKRILAPIYYDYSGISIVLRMP